MRESVIENEFVKAVHEAGGMALKFTSQTINGVPDRLILFKIGKCAFVELKAPGKQMRPLQRKRRQQLEALGFPVFCIDRLEQIQPAIRVLQEWKPGEPIPQGVGAKIPELRKSVIPHTGEAHFNGDESRAEGDHHTEGNHHTEGDRHTEGEHHTGEGTEGWEDC